MVYATVPGPQYEVPSNHEAQLMPLVLDAPGIGVACRVPESDDAARSRVKPCGVGTSALSLTPVIGPKTRAAIEDRCRVGVARGFTDPTVTLTEQPVTAALTTAAKSGIARVRPTMRHSSSPGMHR